MSTVELYLKNGDRSIVFGADTSEVTITEPISDFADFAEFLRKMPKLEKLFLSVADLGKTDYTESLDFLRGARALKWLSIDSMGHLRD